MISSKTISKKKFLINFNIKIQNNLREKLIKRCSREGVIM